MLSKKKISWSELTRMIFVPALLGLVSGLAAALVVESSFASWSAAIAEPIQIGQLPAPASAALQDADLSDRLRRVNVRLYARAAAAIGGGDLSLRARIPSEAVGYATVITSDGWLATSQSALGGGAVLASVGGRLLEPKQQVSDPRTGLVFLKIDATDLPVSAFEDTDAPRSGTPLYVQDESALFARTMFAGAVPIGRQAAAPALQSADRFSRLFRLGRVLGLRATGGAVLTAGGSLAGIVVTSKDGVNAFVPTHLFRPVLSQIFHGQMPARAQLGVNYLTLEEISLSAGGFGDLKGERLTGSRALGLPAVRPGSAADRAGLQEGDILLRADGQDLSGGRDLAEVIAEKEPGAKIRFDVLKDGAERSVDVTLDGEKR